MVEPLSLIGLPSATIRPNGTVISRHAQRARSRMARREFMRVAGAAVVGAGLAFAGLFPTARRASATNQTPSTTWNGCYDGPFVGSTGCCACGSDVGSGNCGSDGWHRHHPVTGGGTYVVYYRLRTASCGGRNSWLWNRSGTTWRCSDGQHRSCVSGGSCSSWSNSVCPKAQ